ncbi:MAG: ATP synthase subunit I [Kiritimatiellia bacterium]|nr:ATP synthase subunit I [Lentisphaerota bacterium]
MQAWQAALIAVAGLLIGWINHLILRHIDVRTRECARSRRNLFMALAYLGRYALIIAMVLWLARLYNPQTAMLLVAGMLAFTIGITIFGPRAR